MQTCSWLACLQAEQLSDTYEAEGADALDKTGTPPGSSEGCIPRQLPCRLAVVSDADVHCVSTSRRYREPESASSEGEKDDSVGAMFTGSIFDQTLSQDREEDGQWGGGGGGSRRGRGRARGMLEAGQDSADELDDGDGGSQADAETEPDEPPVYGPTRRYLYLKVRRMRALITACYSS